MSNLAIIFLLLAAGGALVGQNLLMAQTSAHASTVLIALLLNSAVGLGLLVSILLVRSGLAGVDEALAAVRPTSLLPGLLGTFFVFASICGYQKLGAGSTIAILVTSQLVLGIAADIWRSGSLHGQTWTLTGGALLALGAIIVVSRHP